MSIFNSTEIMDYASYHSQFNVTVPTELDIFYTAVEVACAVAAIIGNVLVIAVFCKYRILRTVTNYYVISLASADLLVGLVGIPSAIATSMGLPRHFQGCLLMNSVLLLLCTSSIFSLVAVSVDRFWAIMWPLTYPSRMNPTSARVIIAVCWVLAAAIGLLPSAGWNKGPPPIPRCFFMEVIDMRYLAFLYFGTILLPSAFMAMVYCVIYNAVRSQVERISSQLVHSQRNSLVPVSQQLRASLTPLSPEPLQQPHRLSQQNPSRKAATKAAQTIFVIVLLFVVSWIPLYTFNTVVCFCPACSLPPGVLKFFIFLSHLNSAWNPCLYAWGMRDFKYCFWRLLGINQRNNQKKYRFQKKPARAISDPPAVPSLGL